MVQIKNPASHGEKYKDFISISSSSTHPITFYMLQMRTTAAQAVFLPFILWSVASSVRKKCPVIYQYLSLTIRNIPQSNHKERPCHGLGEQLPASHHRHPGQSKWDL
jgi:hypothetical protein